MLVPERGEITPVLTKPVRFAQWFSYHGFKIPITLGSCNYIHRDESSCVVSLYRPAQQQSSLTATKKWCTFISNSHRHTTEAIQRWTRSSHKLSSFSFPVQDWNPVCSVLLSLITPVLSLILMLPLLEVFKCYPYGEDHSHLNLNNMEVCDAYRAPLESKAPQGAEPCRIRSVRNKFTLQKSWLILRIRVVSCFLWLLQKVLVTPGDWAHFKRGIPCVIFQLQLLTSYGAAW